MLQVYPVYSLWNRRKTLTGSPDTMHTNSTNKPCNCSSMDPIWGQQWRIQGALALAPPPVGTSSFITACQRSCQKVMFLHFFFCPQVGYNVTSCLVPYSFLGGLPPGCSASRNGIGAISSTHPTEKKVYRFAHPWEILDPRHFWRKPLKRGVSLKIPWPRSSLLWQENLDRSLECSDIICLHRTVLAKVLVSSDIRCFYTYMLFG